MSFALVGEIGCAIEFKIKFHSFCKSLFPFLFYRNVILHALDFKMNLREAILKEHSKKQTTKIVRWIGSNQKKFDQLVELFLKGKYRVTQRAAWSLSDCVINHPELVKKHLKKLITNLNRTDVHDAVIRNTLRLMQFVVIPRPLRGMSADRCFAILNNKSHPVAFHVFSMTVLANLCKEHPEFIRELKHSIQLLKPDATAGYLSRSKKVLKELSNLEKQ